MLTCPFFIYLENLKITHEEVSKMKNTGAKEGCCIFLEKNKVNLMRCCVLLRLYREYIFRLKELLSLSEEDAGKMCGG